MSLKKYSLWLCPTTGSEPHHRLNSAISQFSSILGSPRFAPHLTLHSPVYAESGVDVLEQVRDYVEQLGQKLGDNVRANGIPIGIRDVTTGAHFYQCVLLHAPFSDILLKANAIAREKWNTAKDPKPFYPHVSLIYGDFDQDKKEKLAKQIRDSLPANIREDLSFTAKQVRVVSTAGPFEEWRDIGSVSIASGEITFIKHDH
ncbi:hypothetical protein J3B02_000251 [Coemansia erecta]|uniref:Uncharacterized protein n=1 Tax=Coemansia asiatica TaxID=1052880 RepID=A0A9W7XQV4_9FUNG|nr:hypothetical protein LPJ64_000980 [Coemansia asiatica]KAJ2858379.1 hypothetical protein J3B02_000251 [Coemansia erecta]KAJ2862924.1 hypothetical protein FB639_005334 [Coemansia asiatica]